MSDTTSRLRGIAQESAHDRGQQFSDYDGGTFADHFPMPPAGAFVGENTRAMVVDPALVAAMLDVIDAAEEREQREWSWEAGTGSASEATSAEEKLAVTLARFRKLAGHDLEVQP